MKTPKDHLHPEEVGLYTLFLQGLFPGKTEMSGLCTLSGM